MRRTNRRESGSLQWRLTNLTKQLEAAQGEAATLKIQIESLEQTNSELRADITELQNI